MTSAITNTKHNNSQKLTSLFFNLFCAKKFTHRKEIENKKKTKHNNKTKIKNLTNLHFGSAINKRRRHEEREANFCSDFAKQHNKCASIYQVNSKRIFHN